MIAYRLENKNRWSQNEIEINEDIEEVKGLQGYSGTYEDLMREKIEKIESKAQEIKGGNYDE